MASYLVAYGLDFSTGNDEFSMMGLFLIRLTADRAADIKPPSLFFISGLVVMAALRAAYLRPVEALRQE